MVGSPGAAPAWAVAVMLSLLLSGCVSGTDGEEGPESGGEGGPGHVVQAPDFDFSTAIEEFHDHSDASLHTGSYGLERLGWDPLTSASEAGVLPGGHTEVSVATDDEGRTWAFIGNFGPHRAFSIVDVTDPTGPRHVADFDANPVLELTRPGGGSYWDVAAFPDSDLVVSSAQAIASTPGAGMERPDEVGGGVFLVNTEDKEHPFVESFTQINDLEAQIPAGVHNARPFHIGDIPYVAATTGNGNTFLYEVVGEPGGRTLELRSRVTGVHDTTIQLHPITGQTLLYGAAGGVVITDISDPSDPEIVGSATNGPDLSAYHLIVPNDVLIEGRHFTVSGTETVQGTPPFFTILDTTDPTEPVVVSTWQMPFDEDLYIPGPYRWSTHNFDFDHGRIILGHYHAGVWLIDATSLPNVESPVTLAYYQPHEAPLSVPRTPLGTDVPAVWSAVQHTDGRIYAADVNTGLYILEHTGEPSPLLNETVFPHNQR